MKYMNRQIVLVVVMPQETGALLEEDSVAGPDLPGAGRGLQFVA